MTQLYVLAQQPPTSDGIICPVQADSTEQAIQQAEKTLGVTLCHLHAGDYTDGTRNFFLYVGEKGMEQFGQLFAKTGILRPKPPTFRFSLGQVVATPHVLRAIEASQDVSSTFLIRHQSGDWGDVDQHDARANETALKDGSRIFSVYHLKDRTKIYVLTEAAGDDGRRASTCIMLPDDY